MERKRKLPARASARVEHLAKKRNVTPPAKAESPPTPASEPTPEEPPAPQLPTALQPGKPLPTVDEPQLDNLSSKEYQSIQESGVLAEALQRSRSKWVSDGLFERYWTKPTKKKGVVNEDPKNPPKDSMVKLGQVTITIEPHVFDATMYAVKDNNPKPRPAQSTTKSVFRPILQYGPAAGSMPPPPATPPTSASTSTVAPAATPGQQPPVSQQPIRSGLQASSPLPSTSTQASPSRDLAPPNSASSVANETARPGHSLQSHVPQAPGIPIAPQPDPRGMPPHGVHMPPVSHSPHGQAASIPRPQSANLPAGITPPTTRPGPLAAPLQSPASGPAPAPRGKADDPVIIALAEKASSDATLRELMKRVAEGKANPDELAHFQRVIDQITADHKRKAALAGPPADKLIVDGRTVKYFAGEVKSILQIVLASNASQRSAGLRPPPGSDPLVVLLVKKALDDANTKAIIVRIADGRPDISDAADLKATLDQLLVQKQAAVEKAQNETKSNNRSTPTTTVPATSQPHPSPNGVTNGHLTTTRGHAGTPPPQPLRSRGPPPGPKTDISSIVFEFAGGNGDRYLFPKYSILEYLPGNQQVIASFLIVRKGSTSEYGCDPALDYYQPVTIRLLASSGRHLDNLARVVAPESEVQRYMNSIMDSMTRAEYVLIAMRLPRPSKDEGGDEKENAPESEARGTTVKKVIDADQSPRQNSPSFVSWAKTSSQPDKKPKAPRARAGERQTGRTKTASEDEYEKLIQSTRRKEPNP